MTYVYKIKPKRQIRDITGMPIEILGTHLNNSILALTYAWMTNSSKASFFVNAGWWLDASHFVSGPAEFDWSSWWSYDGISGPGFWGVINRRWRLCSDGRRQSPIDVSTTSLVYDHTLSEISLDAQEVRIANKLGSSISQSNIRIAN